uniref:Uncharacterized protein n=1 Tax=Lepeophtheirus salmonis TaxID=72036 RepID=A0A0K2TB76_LEPSM
MSKSSKSSKSLLVLAALSYEEGFRRLENEYESNSRSRMAELLSVAFEG